MIINDDILNWCKEYKGYKFCITPEKLYNLYNNEKMTLQQIADKYNVSRVTIRNYMKKFNIKIRSNSEAQHLYNKDKFVAKEIIYDMYINKDMNQYEIANKLNISQASIRNWLMAYNINLKKRGNYGIKNGMFKKGHTEKTKNILRAKTIKQFETKESRYKHALLTCEQIKNGKTGKSYNKLESKFAEYLKCKNIKYEQQFRLSKYVYDFYLPENNMLIEINGTYWHADARKYKDKELSLIQIKNIENDKKKKKKAIELNYNYKVVWEIDINEGNYGI